MKGWIGLLGGLMMMASGCDATVASGTVELTLHTDATMRLGNAMLPAQGSMGDSHEYAVLLANAQRLLHRAPSTFQITSAVVSEGTAGAPGSVFAEKVSVVFYLHDQPTLVAAGVVSEDVAAARAVLPPDLTQDLDEDQKERVASGEFAVQLRGFARPEFLDAKGQGTLRLTLDVDLME